MNDGIENPIVKPDKENKDIEDINLNESDRKILKFLMKDSRASVADIARETGIQRDTVMYRIQRFEKKGLINEYHTIVNPAALGLNIFMLVLAKLAPTSKAEIDTFVSKLVSVKYVTHISRIVGKYDYMLVMAAHNIKEFDEALDEIKSIKEGIIQEMEIANIIDGPKTDDFSGFVS